VSVSPTLKITFKTGKGLSTTSRSRLVGKESLAAARAKLPAGLFWWSQVISAITLGSGSVQSWLDPKEMARLLFGIKWQKWIYRYERALWSVVGHAPRF